MGAKDGSEESKEIEVKMNTVNVRLGSHRKTDSAMEPRDVVVDARSHIENYMEWCKDSLDWRRFKTIAVDTLRLYIYDLCNVRRDRCVGTRRRCRGAGPKLEETAVGVPLADLLLVRLEEIAYFRMLRDSMAGLGAVKIAVG